MRVTIMVQDDELIGIREQIYQEVHTDPDVVSYPIYNPEFLQEVQERLLARLEDQDDPFSESFQQLIKCFGFVPEQIDELEFIGEQGILRLTTIL